MSQVCCVEHCNHSRSKNKCTLKRFPTDTQKCKLWDDIIKRDGWERTSWDRICECHFSDEQFEQNRADGLRKLRWDAVPTLFGSNLRVLAKAATEDVGDKKDSDERLEDNDELEELEVEIEENSNSDENSDVETYIITGDLSNTIQVIKERESPSSTRSNEKQPSDSPPIGKSKTKRIVIRVPSSVGDCSSTLSENVGEDVDGDGADQERIQQFVQEKQGTIEQQLGESRLTENSVEDSRLTEGPVEERRLTEDPVEESRLTEDPVVESRLIDPGQESRLVGDPVEESTLVEDPADKNGIELAANLGEESRLIGDPVEKSELTDDLVKESDLTEDPVKENDLTENPGEERICSDKLEEDIPDRQWDVGNSIEGEPVESSSVRRDSVENLVESLNVGEATTRNLEGNMEEVSGETSNTREEAASAEMDARILSADNVGEPFSSERSVDNPESDFSHLKSDWKNPKLKARDVKIMACGGSSKMLYKKRHQLLQSRASHDNDHVTDESKTEKIVECVENEEAADCVRGEGPSSCESPELSEVEMQEAASRDIAADCARGEGPPSREPKESSEVEKLDEASEDTASHVSHGKEYSVGADDAIVSIEEKLEKIFSNEGERSEEAIARVESPENEQEKDLPKMAEEETPLGEQEEVGMTEPDLPSEETGSQSAQVSSDADLEKQLAQDTELPSMVEVTQREDAKNVDETEGSFESPKNEKKSRDKALKKSPKKRDAPSESNNTEEEDRKKQEKKSPKKRDAPSESNDTEEEDRKKQEKKSPKKRDAPSESNDTEEEDRKKQEKKSPKKRDAPSESNDTEEEDRKKQEKKSPKKRDAPSESNDTEEEDRKKQEKSQSRSKSRASKDSVEETRRSSSSRREHSNHKEASRRSEKESSSKKSSPEKSSRQHNSHGVSKRTSTEAKKSSDEDRLDSGKRQVKAHSPTKESLRQCAKVAEAEVKISTKTKEEPKELRSSKRCLVTTAITRRKQPIKEEVVEDSEEGDGDEELPIKKAKTIEEAVTPAQTKRRGRPPKGRESSSEKALVEESKSLRHSKRTPKPSEKYRDSQSGKSSRPSEVSADELQRRSQKRKFSSEEEEDSVRKTGRGARAARAMKRKSSRGVSPVVPVRRRDVRNVRSEEHEDGDEEDEDEDDTGVAQPICRVCGTEQQILLSIFGPEGSQLRLENKIHSHLPIRVRPEDKLPLGVCHSCVVTLSACDTLVDKCTQVDKRLRKMFNCPPDETIEESNRCRVRKDKARPQALAGPSQIAQQQSKEAEPQQAKPSPEPTVPVVAVSDVSAATEPAEPVPVAPVPVAPIPVAPVEETAPAPIAEPEYAGDVIEEQVEEAEVVHSAMEMQPQQETCSEPVLVMTDQMSEAIPIQHDAILVKKEEYDSEMISPMKRFGNTYSTGRRSTNRAMDAMEPTLQDRNSVIVIPAAETLRPSNNDVPPHSEEYILSMDEPPDDAPKTVIDSILDDWDEDEQASTSANSRVLTIKNPPDSEIVVTRLYNDEEEILAEGESGEIIIQIQEFSGETREQPFWPAPEPEPEPTEETIIPDTDEQQNLTWKCGECGLRGKSVGAFLEHKKGHQVQEKKFFCSLCDQSFASVEMLALHKKEKHYEDDEDDEDDELAVHTKKSKQLAPLDIEEGGFYPGGNCKLYKCAQCDKMFGAAWSWKKHMEAHELDSSLADNRVHKCDVCNRVFFDKTTFEDHKLTHMEGETPFQCSICDAKFATWNVFLTHVHTHKSSKTICKKCGRDFGDAKILRDHVKEAHPIVNDKKFACHLCDKVCRKKIALTEHIRKHTGEMPFECEVCHKRFSRLANYRAHAAIHENQRRFACDVCGKRFNRQSIQQRHMKTHTRDTIKTSHVCRVCGEAFNKVNELLEHRLNHTRDDVERAYWMDVKLRGDAQDFSCKVCDMRFTTVEAVLLHMPSHTDDERDIALKRKPKAYTCDICHRTLWSKRTFQTHKQWHEQKQFPCTQCDKKYATQTGLNYHMFLHTGERPFQCSFCDKCYKNKNDLRIHVRLHTGEYPYKCKFCPKAFRSPSSLIKHGDAHTEERPFKCSYCDQAFKRENTRANHERIHTNDKRFTCKYCNKGFIQKGACMKHEKWHESANKKSTAAEENPEENLDENDSRDTLEIPEPSDTDDSMDSFQVDHMEEQERDVKEEEEEGLSLPGQPSQIIVAEPVDGANATAPSSADNNIHITLL